MIYGKPPTSLGVVDLRVTEMMYWMYCPIKEPGVNNVTVPDNLRQFAELIQLVREDCADRWQDSYVYITAKNLWVGGDYIGNRPGWHSDGFGSNDLNYIWADRAPTEFALGQWEFSEDHNESLIEMEAAAKDAIHFKYPDKALLRLDPSVIHRCPVDFEPGFRAFVKISISTEQYNLEGNSINHALTRFEFQPREDHRNHPVK